MPIVSNHVCGMLQILHFPLSPSLRFNDEYAGGTNRDMIHVEPFERHIVEHAIAFRKQLIEFLPNQALSSKSQLIFPIIPERTENARSRDCCYSKDDQTSHP